MTEFKIESKISLLRKILRNILRFGKFFCYKSPNHIQIHTYMTLFEENYDFTEFMLGLVTRAEHCATQLFLSRENHSTLLHINS